MKPSSTLTALTPTSVDRIAALEDEHGRETGTRKVLADAQVVWRAEGEARDRIALESVEPQRHDQRARLEPGDAAERILQRIAPDREAGAARQRQVAVEAQPVALAALVCVAQVIGVLGVRIAVDAGELHVGALVEDGLGAVAVVIVDVEHGHAIDDARVAQRLCGNGRVVEEAVAAKEVRAGMVARRPRERECGTLALQHARGGCQRASGARMRGFPCAGSERRAGVIREQPHARGKTGRQHVGAEGADRPVRRQGIAPGIGGIERDPFVPRVGKEVEVARRMDAGDGGVVERVRRFDRPELAPLQFLQHVVGTRGISKHGTSSPRNISNLP